MSLPSAVPVEPEEPTTPGGGINSGPPVITPEKQLISRAETLKGAKFREERMFVQFDAWTDPRILGWLQANPKQLKGRARNLFVNGRPQIDLGLLNCAFAILTDAPLDRAVRRAAGAKYDVEVLISEDAEFLLQKNKTTVRDVIRDLARYLHEIFAHHFQQKGKKVPSKELKLSFIRFGSGQLRISDGGREWMNAEPDSAYFFAFAEFCIQAAFFEAAPSREWWLSLGGLFAALQDVYCLRYHHKGAPRQVTEYGDKWYDGRRPIPDKLLLQHVESVQDRDGTLEKLVERVTWNAFWYFFDDVLG